MGLLDRPMGRNAHHPNGYLQTQSVVYQVPNGLAIRQREHQLELVGRFVADQAANLSLLHRGEMSPLAWLASTCFDLDRRPAASQIGPVRRHHGGY